MDGSHDSAEGVKGTKRRTVSLALCLGCIFFGSCAENAMTNWVSGYMESALGVDKALGDILGMAMFAVLLVIARLLYAKYGKNIMRVLLLGMIGASVCYIAAGVVSNVFVAFGACILTGFCTSMLWPGTLIMMEENVPNAGVAAFALMAAGGDLGASVAPQLMGIVIDSVSASPFAQTFATPEEIGMRAGMLVTAIFPIIGIVVVALTMRYFKKAK
jgi:MFS family permease